MSRRGRGAAIGVLTALPALGLAAAANDVTTGTNVSTCNNPVLNKTLTGWDAIRGRPRCGRRSPTTPPRGSPAPPGLGWPVASGPN